MFAEAAEIIGTIDRPQRWAATICRFVAWMALALALVVIPASAHAQASGSAQARAEWAKIQEAEQQLARIEAALARFEPKKSYCKPVHPDDKSVDRAYLDSLKADAEAEIKAMGEARTALVRLFGTDQRTKAAVDGIKRGAADSLIDGSYRQAADKLLRSIRQLHTQKQKVLTEALEHPCAGGVGTESGGGTGVIGGGGTVAPADPLAGVQLEPPAALETAPSVPTRYCTQDEKNQAISAITAARVRNADDAMALDRFAGDLRSLRGTIQDKATATSQALAAARAARRPSREEIAGLEAQLKAYRDALARMSAAIAKAQALLAKVDALASQLDAMLKAAQAAKVVDCLGADPQKDAIGSIGQNLGDGVPGVSLKSVEIPAPIPDHFCSEDEKNALIVRAATAYSNAVANRSAWESRLLAVIDAQRRGKGDADGLQKAREEARTEHARWKKIVDAADAAFDAINAAPVIDCTPPRKVGMIDGGGGGTASGALDAAIGSNPAARDRMAADGWGAAGEGGNANGDGVLTGPGQGGQFDGGEAERALNERMQDAERTHRMPAPGGYPDEPRDEPAPVVPGQTLVEPGSTALPQTEPQETTPVPTVPGHVLIDPQPPEPPAQEDPPYQPGDSVIRLLGDDDRTPVISSLTPPTVEPTLTLPAGGESGYAGTVTPLATGPVTFTAYTGPAAPAPSTGGMTLIAPPPLILQTGPSASDPTRTCCMTQVAPPPLVTQSGPAPAPPGGSMAGALTAAMGAK